MPDRLQQYLKRIERALVAGNATEHTHRPALKELVECMTEGITATNEPKRVKCGAPDFIVTRGETPLGYIEAKDVGEPLDKVERSEQMKRYLESLGNLILTDYLEPRWYVRGKHRLTARLATVGASGRLRIETDGERQLTELLNAFLTAQVPTVASPKELAVHIAALARLIRGTIRRAFEDEDKGGSLHQQMEGFRKVLLHDLSEEQFADMYAQTICYGLFAARCNAKGGQRFTRQHAAYDLPKTNPFLRKMFSHIAGPDLDDRIVWAVDDLAELLHRADISAILQDFGKRTRREDPVVHFYETFLAAYDPALRETRGVYYTPEPVVSYIVSSIDLILKTDFGLPEGLAHAGKVKLKSGDGKGKTEVHKVLILDPAAGTGTFLYNVIEHIYESFKGNRGMWSGYVSEHLLPRLFGFELLMAPYAVAHMKLGLQLAELGYDFKADERLGIYLTNTLEEAHKMSGLPLFTHWLAEEANAASEIKREVPVMVILGNPPYSGHSANTGEWITRLLRGTDTQTSEKTWNYFEVDGKPLGERNPKLLNDDYVKFIRFAQWRIEKTGYGILAFITNHGYLDNPTFRGMRQCLTETFDDIYVLDLHGSSKKRERAPDGSKDENVFDIQQGVAIGIFVKRRSAAVPAAGARASRTSSRGQDARQTASEDAGATSVSTSAGATHVAIVRHAHLWGVRAAYEKNAQGEPVLSDGKYHWLWQNDVSTTKWTKLKLQPPFYLFVPQDTELKPEYDLGWKIIEAMPINSSCMNTARDSLVIDVDKSGLLNRIRLIANCGENTGEIAEALDIRSTPWWSFGAAAQKLRETPSWENLIIRCLYRPFDQRWLFYHPAFIDRPRIEINSHMLQENISLVTTRQTKEPFAVVVTNLVCGQHKIAAVYDRSYFFPLYLYPPASKKDLLDNNEPTDARAVRHPNLAPKFIEDLATRLKMKFIPDGKGDLGSAAVPAAGARASRTSSGKQDVRHTASEDAGATTAGTFGPEDVFDYLYAVFHSPTYRKRYAEFLKIDFPRLPLTSNADLFRALCGLGEELVALHLMEKQAPIITRYPVAGDNTVETVRYTEPGQGADTGRVWINKTQYFEGVPPEVWNFHVGGYQVCQKWLKDRKGRQLTYDDLTHYQRVVAALRDMIHLMSEIDETINEHGGWPM